MRLHRGWESGRVDPSTMEEEVVVLRGKEVRDGRRNVPESGAEGSAEEYEAAADAAADDVVDDVEGDVEGSAVLERLMAFRGEIPPLRYRESGMTAR